MKKRQLPPIRFNAPCRNLDCFCEPREAATAGSREVFARMEFKVGTEHFSQPLEITMPAESQLREVLRCAARKTGEENNCQSVMVYFHLDGGNEPLTIWQHLTDRWSRVSYRHRGLAVTASMFVPIWPPLAPRPLPASFRTMNAGEIESLIASFPPGSNQC